MQLHGVMLRRSKDHVLALPPKLRTWLPVEVPAGTGVARHEEGRGAAGRRRQTRARFDGRREPLARRACCTP